MDKLWIGTLMGALLVLFIVVAGRMSYDQGYATGQLEGRNKIDRCLDKCNNKLNETVACYQIRCMDLCNTESMYNSYYNQEFPLFR